MIFFSLDHCYLRRTTSSTVDLHLYSLLSLSPLYITPLFSTLYLYSLQTRTENPTADHKQMAPAHCLCVCWDPIHKATHGREPGDGATARTQLQIWGMFRVLTSAWV